MSKINKLATLKIRDSFDYSFSERGGTVVEAVMSLPFLLFLIIFPAIDFSRYLFVSQTAQYAVSEAIRAGSVWEFNGEVERNIVIKDKLEDLLKSINVSFDGNEHDGDLLICPLHMLSDCVDQKHSRSSQPGEIVYVSLHIPFEPILLPGVTFEISAGAIARNEIAIQASEL